jgi:hypothetical protein
LSRFLLWGGMIGACFAMPNSALDGFGQAARVFAGIFIVLQVGAAAVEAARATHRCWLGLPCLLQPPVHAPHHRIAAHHPAGVLLRRE